MGATELHLMAPCLGRRCRMDGWESRARLAFDLDGGFLMDGILSERYKRYAIFVCHARECWNDMRVGKSMVVWTGGSRLAAHDGGVVAHHLTGRGCAGGERSFFPRDIPCGGQDYAAAGHSNHHLLANAPPLPPALCYSLTYFVLIAYRGKGRCRHSYQRSFGPEGTETCISGSTPVRPPCIGPASAMRAIAVSIWPQVWAI